MVVTIVECPSYVFKFFTINTPYENDYIMYVPPHPPPAAAHREYVC